MPDKTDTTDYEIIGAKSGAIAAPGLPYQPQNPKTYRPAIGLIACGGITQSHLTAYKKAGYNVVILCDLIKEKAESRRDEFFPGAKITADYRDVLARPDVEVVDIATHPRERAPLIEAALRANKHVLSQKPFVLDLAVGKKLADLADTQNKKLAVNQNGRWSPHFSYIRQAVQAGLIGEVLSVHMGVHWDHTWTKGTPFEAIRDLVLYDFGIHWFDMVSHLFAGNEAQQVSAFRTPAKNQEIAPPLLAQTIVAFEGGQASLSFDAALPFGPHDHTFVGGTKGTLVSVGPNLGKQTVTLTTEAGAATPLLSGSWFPEGFHGSMGELLCAIEENRQPINNARDNLRGLALCFAAIASASEGGKPMVPRDITRLPAGAAPGV